MKKLLVVFAWVMRFTYVYAQCSCSSSIGCSPVFSGNIYQTYNGTALELNQELRLFKLPNELKHADEAEKAQLLKTLWLKQAILNYRLNPFWQLNISLPYLTIITHNQTIVNGLGDATLTNLFLPFKKPSLFLIAGVKLPTGPYKALHNQNNSFIGSGSFDPIIGLRFIKTWKKISWQSNALFRYATKGYKDTRYGNFSNITSGVNWVILKWGGDSLTSSPRNLMLYLGNSFEYYGLQLTGVVWNTNSGGYALWLPFFLSVAKKKWQLTSGVELPLYQLQNGIQLKQSNRFKLTLIKNF